MQLTAPQEARPETKAGESLVAVKALVKSFGERKVLDGVDLTVRRGETVCVLGKSGTGKSVLLKLLIGLQKPDSGTISISGREITNLAMDELNEVRKKIGFLFQQAALYDSLTVADNVDFPLSRHTKEPQAARREKAARLLASVGMDRDMDKMPSEISGGMQKRVGIARALALEPELLFFDEPTSGLDPITATEIGNLIAQLNKERSTTAIVVTHDVSAARLFANHFIVLNEGHVAAEGTFEELKKSQDPFVKQFLGSIN